jgi:class 3 adenylate cyclase
VLLEHLGRQAATAINNALLLGKLSAHMGLYSRQGARDLVERLDQPARREMLTMLFADMRGFTQLCQSQGDPTRTQEIMNDLMTMLADQVLTRGGIVNKFVGDAVFALFRDKDGPKQAVKCASGMLDRFDSLRRRWVDSCSEDLSFLDLGIGIATGPVAFGSFGSATVRDFTAIGTSVNLAAAFEAAARNGRRLLVDQPTWNAVNSIVSDFDGPTSFELGKPGQAVSIKYRQYHIKRLKPDVPVRVFVSHNHRDREFVERNITAQLATYGIETWYSNIDIIPGEKYVQTIEAGLMKCDWVLVFVTEHSAQSDWVRAEVRTAFDDPRFRNRILPVRADDVELSRISDQLGQLHAVDARQNGNLGESLYRLLMKREGEMQPNSAGV